MDDDDVIKVGDKVFVTFVTGGSFFGTVRFIPVTNGDSWRFTPEGGGCMLIQSFQTMSRQDRGK